MDTSGHFINLCYQFCYQIHPPVIDISSGYCHIKPMHEEFRSTGRYQREIIPPIEMMLLSLGRGPSMQNFVAGTQRSLAPRERCAKFRRDRPTGGGIFHAPVNVMYGSASRSSQFNLFHRKRQASYLFTIFVTILVTRCSIQTSA